MDSGNAKCFQEVSGLKNYRLTTKIYKKIHLKSRNLKDQINEK